MHIRPRLVLASIGALALLIPLMGTSAAQAGTAGPATGTPTCVVHSNPSQVETGLGPTTSSISDVIQVECKPSFSEQYVEISSPQLNALCDNTLSWYSFSTNVVGYGESYEVYLDDDGNATAAVWGGPSCAAGKALITADLTVAPFTTAKTTFTVLPPTSTKKGITAAPASEVEGSTYSDVYDVFNIEFPSVFSEDEVEVSSPQLVTRCDFSQWVGPDEDVLGTDTQSVDVYLDDDGNAFVTFIGAGCSTGKSLVTADLLAPPYTTLQTHFTILEPTPTVGPMRHLGAAALRSLAGLRAGLR